MGYKGYKGYNPLIRSPLNLPALPHFRHILPAWPLWNGGFYGFIEGCRWCSRTQSQVSLPSSCNFFASPLYKISRWDRVQIIIITNTIQDRAQVFVPSRIQPEKLHLLSSSSKRWLQFKGGRINPHFFQPMEFLSKCWVPGSRNLPKSPEFVNHFHLLGADPPSTPPT